MCVYVYILHSATLDQFYVGITERLALRLKQHRRGQGRWSSRASDWERMYVAKMRDYSDARALEKRIKKRGVKRYLSAVASQSRRMAGQG